MSDERSDNAVWKYDVDDGSLRERTIDTIRRLRAFHRVLEHAMEDMALNRETAPDIESSTSGETEAIDWTATNGPEVRSAIDSLTRTVRGIEEAMGRPFGFMLMV